MDCEHTTFTGKTRGCFLTDGFTLIELLAVIAIICLLLSVLVPGVGVAKRTFAKSKTKIQFNQYIAALELYKHDHGCYPDFINEGNPVNLAKHSYDFIETLSGEYYTFSDYEINQDGSIVDAFKNPNIYIVVSNEQNKEALRLYTLASDGVEVVKSWE